MQKKNTKKITKDMTIADIITAHAKASEVMMEHGMHCIGCHVALDETLEQGAFSHGISVDKLLRDLNNKLLA